MARRKNTLRRGYADKIHIADVHEIREAGLPSLRPYDVSIGVEAHLAIRVMASGLDHAAKLSNEVAQNALTKISNRGKPIESGAQKGHSFYAWPAGIRSVGPAKDLIAVSAEAGTGRRVARKGRRRTAR